ncbi:tyrosine-type recombinase/integrase [Brucella anthropi]|uniref:tyrosine-type recombinase/integrase n=1 Tax=Brucella anthropi TaxID=529 RepID=UPI003672879B
MPITKTDVEGLPPNSIIWDSGRGSVAGFGVRRQRAVQVFIVKYSARGRARWVSIGKFGAPWTVETARLEAKRILGLVATGIDPAKERDEQKTQAEPLTVAELCDQYMKAAEAGAVLTRFNRPKKPSTIETDKGRIARHIKPLLGKMAVIDVDARVVKRMIHDITVGKTKAITKTKKRGRAVVTGGASTAARTADMLSGIMTWAVDEGLIQINPVHRVRRFRAQPRQRFLNEKELAQLGAVLRHGKDDTDKAFHPFAIKIVTLLALTGCRLSEISALRWQEFDADQKCLRLADTKTGQSIRAIGSYAVTLLKETDVHAGKTWVFPANRGEKSYHGMNHEAVRIFQAAKLENVTCHTLRHTYASYASELGYSDGTIGGLLGHKGRGVTSRYIHRPDNALLSAAEEICQRINMLMAANL